MVRLGRRALLATLLSVPLLGGPLPGCSDPKPTKVAGGPATADYASALDPNAPIQLFVRPTALRRDDVFGPLVSTLSRLAASRGVAGTRELEAFESAEELLVAVDAEGKKVPQSDVLSLTSGVVVVRGVRADFVPEKLLDGDGRLLFKSGRPRGAVVEHEGYVDDPLALFVLPRRTWVVAFGAAASRARVGLFDGRPKAPPVFDPEALLELRIDGQSLVGHVPKLERGDLALGRRLSDARLLLKPGRGGVILLLTYTDVDAAAWAENTLGRVVAAFSRKLEGPMAWLGGTTVVREGNLVRLRSEVPPRVVEALQRIDAKALLEGRDIDAAAPAPLPADAGSDAR
jgi:hypothetical protein